jgi:ubiquinone biosynthesis protein UbiJ
MDVRRYFTKRAAVWLVLGLIGGGIAADGWWRQHTRAVDRQLEQLQASAASEHARAGKVESELSATAAEIQRLKEEVERLTAQLRAERDLRHRDEDLASRGQK